MAHFTNQTGDSPKPDSRILDQNEATNGRWSVESVISSLPHPPQAGTNSPVPFFHILERLKTTKREGWRRFGIDRGESIADHMYRMSILTMLAPQPLASKINVPHCMKMALIHDMAEALVGDITPVDGVSKEEKSRREEETIDYLCNKVLGNVGGGISGQEIARIWREYEDGRTLEAEFVKDIDKMELVLQMVEYERSGSGKVDLGEFTWVAKKIRLPEVRKWCNDVLEERRQFWESLEKAPTDFSHSDNPDAVREAQQGEYYREDQG